MMAGGRPLRLLEEGIIVYSCGCWEYGGVGDIPDYDCPVCSGGYYESVMV